MDIERFIECHPRSNAVLGIDNNLMFIVDDAKKWHEENVTLNSEEYYKNNILGKISDKRNRSDDEINYGVIDFDELSNVMLNWENIAVSSRFLKEPDFLHYPVSSWDSCAYLMDTYLQHNRENAVLVNLLADETNKVGDLLCKIFSNNKETMDETKSYVRDNYYSLVNLFGLDYDHEFYYVDGDRVYLSYELLERYSTVILPKTLLKYFEKNNISINDRRKVLLATKEYLKKKKSHDKDLLNSSYCNEYIRNSSFTLK